MHWYEQFFQFLNELEQINNAGLSYLSLTMYHCCMQQLTLEYLSNYCKNFG